MLSDPAFCLESDSEEFATLRPPASAQDGHTPIGSPKRTGRSGAQAGLKSMIPGAKSITIVEPRRNRPISSPFRRKMLLSS
jgi:hypothetical protein